MELISKTTISRARTSGSGFCFYKFGVGGTMVRIGWGGGVNEYVA